MARIAFGEFREGLRPNDYCWAVLYRGKLTAFRPITFRFWGAADSILTVRVNGRVVLDAPLNPRSGGLAPFWHSRSADSHRYYFGNAKAVVGDWISLRPGEPLNIEMLAVDLGGGAFSAMLLVEEKGKHYAQNRQGAPILPVFRTEPLSPALQDMIRLYLPAGEADLEQGPVFSDCCTADADAGARLLPPPPPLRMFRPEEHSERSWHPAGGTIVRGRLIRRIGREVVIAHGKKKTIRIPLDRLPLEERTYVFREEPPRFEIDFSHCTRKVKVPPSILSGWKQPRMFRCRFRLHLKQSSAGDYPLPLRAEYFAFGKEIGGPRYHLLDHRVFRFIPSELPGRKISFEGGEVLFRDSVFYRQRRGERYGGYLVLLIDEQDRIIQYETSHDWAFHHLERLRRLPTGAWFDKSCRRVSPTPPDPFYY